MVTVMNYTVWQKIYLLPHFWEFSHYSFTKQQFSSVRKTFRQFGEPPTFDMDLGKKKFRLGHNRDLINLDMTS